MPLFQSNRARKNLIDRLTLDTPHVTEFRRLLQNLYRQQKAASKELRSYMVTSAGRGEGKSTVSAFLAIVSARIFHKRTLLVDADLHRPTIHSLLGVARGPGLGEILRGKATIQEATRSTPIPELWVIPSGYPNQSVSETFTDEKFAQILQELNPSYDVIFVDAPPAVPAIEPILMAEHVDAILVVAMAGRTPLAMVRRSMQILAPVSEKIAGIVLNNAADGLPYFYNSRYYGYEDAKTPQVRRPPPPRPEPKHANKLEKHNGGRN